MAWKLGPNPEGGGFKHHQAVPYLCISHCLSKDICVTCTWFRTDLRICHSQGHWPAIKSQQQWGTSFWTMINVSKANKCMLKWMSSLKVLQFRYCKSKKKWEKKKMKTSLPSHMFSISLLCGTANANNYSLVTTREVKCAKSCVAPSIIKAKCTWNDLRWEAECNLRLSLKMKRCCLQRKM